MTALEYPDPLDFHRDIGAPAPPDQITQKAFDYDQAPLEALAARRVGDGPCPELVCEYALDLKYTEPLQADLMAYVLPLCLETWQHQLRVNRRHAVNERLHGALAARPALIENTLGPGVAERFFAFQRRSLLARMAAESSLRHSGMNALPYTWISTLASYGTYGPDMNEILGAWGQVRDHAIAWIQYLSVLVFDSKNSPVFDPWTAGAGGGPPELWGYDSDDFKERWSDAAIAALRLFLEPDAVVERTRRAVNVLDQHPHHEVAVHVLDRVLDSPDRVGARAARLCEILATPSEVGLFDWEDA